MYDVFISHASDDRKAVAKPLAKALKVAGLEVWYDEFTLSVGDNLRHSIEKGLRKSRFGVVILSPSFFAKEWPQRELDGLLSKEEGSKEKVILPVWHNIKGKEIRRYSPILAQRKGVSTDQGIEEVAAHIVQVVKAQVPVRKKQREKPAITKPEPTKVKIEKSLTPTRSYATVSVRLRVDHNIIIEQKPALPSGMHLFISVDGKVVVKERTRTMIFPNAVDYPFMIEDIDCKARLSGAVGIYRVHLIIGDKEIAAIF